MARRQDAVLGLGKLAQSTHLQLSGGHERLRLRYVPSFDPHSPQGNEQQLELSLDLPPPISLPQNVATIGQVFLDRLRASWREDWQRGMTMLGPHRDDIRFYDRQIDLHTYGSRGQQRTAVLALKLAEVELMHQTTGEQPILLLDEVMSELDADRRRYLCTRLLRVQQAIISTTDLDAVTPEILDRATVFHVMAGRLTSLRSEPSADKLDVISSTQPNE
jgi:DNA replication and repair protein RecF